MAPSRSPEKEKLDDWLKIRDEREKRSPDDLRIGKLMAQLVALDEPELSEEYADLSTLLSNLSLKRGCFNLNGILRSYSESAKSRALALVFNLVESSSIQSLLLRNNAIESETLHSALSAFNADTRGQRKLLRLETLDLSDNRLGASGVKTFSESEVSGVEALASALGKGWLPALQELRLSYNDIEYSDFQALATAFNTGNVSLLKILDLGKNSPFQAFNPHRALAEALTLPNLEELRVSRCNLDSDCCKVYADAIRSGHLSKLKAVDFSENYTYGEGAKYLAEALTSSAVNNTLREIDLSGNYIHDAGVCALAASLEAAESGKLQVLRLRGTGMKTEGLQGITRAITSGNLQSLEVLDLSSNHLSSRIYAEADSRFAKSLPRLTRLRELYLQCTRMETAGLQGITAAITSGNLQSLEVLNLSSSCNLFRDEALVRSFAESLPRLTGLREMYLRDIERGVEKLLPITRVLEQGGLLSLEVLDLSDNSSPGNKGIADLAKSFRHMFMRLKSRELRLHKIGIGNPGLKEIAKAKEGGLFESLEILDLSSNSSIGDAGVLAVLACRFKKLKDLLLYGTRVGDKGLQGIVKAFESGHLPSLELVDVRMTPCTKKIEISGEISSREKVIRRECSEKSAGRVLGEISSDTAPLQQDIRYRYAVIIREDKDFDQGTQILDLNEEAERVDENEHFDQEIQTLDLLGKGNKVDQNQDFDKGAQILDLKSEEAKTAAQWGSSRTGWPSSSSAVASVLSSSLQKKEEMGSIGSQPAGASFAWPCVIKKEEMGSTGSQPAGASFAWPCVIKKEDVDQGTEMFDLKEVKNVDYVEELPKGDTSDLYKEAKPVDFVHGPAQLPVPPIGSENVRSNVLDLNEEAEPMEYAEGPQLHELFTGAQNVRLDTRGSGMETEIGVDMVVGNAIRSSSRSPLSRDIQLMGFTSFEDKFNPDRILFVYDVAMSMERVEMAFFHTEGMASLFGIGLPFSKVLVEADFTVTIQEVSEHAWNSLWNDSSHGSYKPMIFNHCVENVSSTSFPKFSNLSTEEALSKFGVAMEGRNHFKPKNVGLPNRDESNILNFGVGWVRWFDKVLKKQKALEMTKHGGEQGIPGGYKYPSKRAKSVQRKRKSRVDDKGSTSGMNGGLNFDGLWEALYLSPGQEAGSFVASEEEVNDNDIKILAILVKMDHQHSKLLEDKWVQEIGGEEILTQLFVERDRIANDDALKNCFIKPTMKIEFLYKGHSDLNEASKSVNVTLEVDYQIDSNLDDVLKFGWHQKDLQLSFHCEDTTATIMDACKINSPLETSDLESMTNRSKSQSSSEGSNMEAGGKVGPRAIGQAEVKMGVKMESVDGSSNVNQEVRKSKLRCLAEAPSFAIVSKCVGDRMAYRAFLWDHIESHKLWDDSERLRAEAKAGMFSTINVEVQGSWELKGTDFKTHVFQAKKVLQQHQRASRNVLVSTVKTLVQEFVRKFMLNHSFSHFHTLKKSAPYEWVLEKGDEDCPIASILN